MSTSLAGPATARPPAEAAVVMRAGAASSNVARAWRRFRANPLALPACALLALLLVFGFGAPLVERFLTGQSPTAQSLLHNFEPPTAQHWLGTDEYGRDVFTRLAFGGQVSLGVAVLAASFAVLIGTSVGAVAAYYGGWVDQALMRLVDVLLCVPAIYLLLLVSSLVDVGPLGLAVLIALLGWFGLARLIRGEVLSLRQREFVQAARVIGATDPAIIVRHLLPNVLHLVIIFATGAVPGFILAEAGLSFLGMGIRPPAASWGNMLTNAQQYLYKSPGLIVFPGLALTLTVVALAVVGNALRDALDPRSGA